MTKIQFEGQQWQFRNGSALETSAVFRGVLDGSIPRDSQIRSSDDPGWRTVHECFKTIGPYGLLGELGEGGFGKVYRAFDTRRLRDDGRPSRLVALKYPSPSLLERYARAAGRKAKSDLSTEENRRQDREWAKSQLGQAFSTETALTARLATCDYVVKVLDHDVTVPYVALEFCDGGSLADRMARSYELSELILWGKQIAEALATAHSLQPDALVHRDLKPENVLVHEGVMKVSDFGTSQMIQQTSSLRSLRGGYTPAYAAPEAFYGKAYPGTDVWSLGVILYELLAGRRPFVGENMMQLGRAIDEASPPPLEEQTAVAAPRPLITLVHSCLQKDPEARPSADIVRDCLAAFLDPNIASATLPELVIPSARPAPQSKAGPYDSTVTEDRSRPAPSAIPKSAQAAPPPAPQAPPDKPAPVAAKKRGGLLIGMLALLLIVAGGVAANAFYGEAIREAILGPRKASPKEKASAARSSWGEVCRRYGTLAPKPDESQLAEETFQKALKYEDPADQAAAALFVKAAELFDRCAAGYPGAATKVYEARRDRIVKRGERAKEELARWPELQATERPQLTQAELKLGLARDMASPGTYRESAAYLSEAEVLFEGCLSKIAEAAVKPLKSARREAEAARKRYQDLAERSEPDEAARLRADESLADLGQAAAFADDSRFREAIDLYEESKGSFTEIADALAAKLEAVKKARGDATAAAESARAAQSRWTTLAASAKEPLELAGLSEAQKTLSAGEEALENTRYAEAATAFKSAEAAFEALRKEAASVLAKRRALIEARASREASLEAQTAWLAAAAKAPKSWKIPASAGEARAALSQGEAFLKAEKGPEAAAAFTQARKLFDKGRAAAEAAIKAEEKRRREAAETARKAAEAKARRIRKLLGNRTEWNTSTKEAQDEAIAAVAAKLGKAFQLIETREYRSGGQAHRIATFRHRASGCDLNLIPGGSYTMGSDQDSFEQPTHTVDIKGPFLIGKTEVSQAQWDRIGGEDRRNHRGARLPIDSCSWVDVQKWLKKAGAGLRLPSEAEWEYAARAGTQTDYPFGNNLFELKDYSWFAENARRKPHDVGVKKANAFGLHDVLGNMLEWCQDSWIDNYKSGPKDQAPRSDKAASGYVLRGGSWNLKNDNARVSCRFWYGPANRYDFIGLRLALSIDLD